MRAFLVLLLLSAALIAPAGILAEGRASPRADAPPGRIAFASSRGNAGNTDIFSADVGGTNIINLTDNPAPDRSPSWSPDGRRIVFSSRRGDNWDLYVMGADGGEAQRLTDDPAYDGEPAWSPDGSRLAFTSNRDGDLDIYLLELGSGAVRRLTDDPAADYAPAWAPDGRRLAFASWRDGNQEIYALYVLEETDGSALPAQNLSNHPAPDYSPAWSPDGWRLAFISDREGNGNLHVLDLRYGTQQIAGVRNRSLLDPAWTPSGGLLAVGPSAARGQRFSSNQAVLVMTAGISVSVTLVASPHTYAEPEWSAAAIMPAVPADRLLPGRIYPAPAPPIDLAQITAGFAGLGDVRAGGQPRLAQAVQPSFMDLRHAVIGATGYDFLARLSEATRPAGFSSASSSYASWHKAGRAFDTVFDYRAGGRQVLYIAPERLSGRLFWRLYLRTARQDGSQGTPITLPVFNPSSRTLSPPPNGYFVDFTDLATQYGWRRIAAQERENFDWRSELLALEYWHFERRDGLSWYQAMSLVYDDTTLERLFNVEEMLAAGARPDSIGRLGLPWATPAPPTGRPGSWVGQVPN